MYVVKEIDNSGLEGFRCCNKQHIKKTNSGWCYPMCATNIECSTCEDYKPKQTEKLTRKQVIEISEKADSTVYKEPKTITAQALEYAIADIKKLDKIEQMVEEIYETNKKTSNR